MRLKPAARDRLLEDFARRLNAGALVIYAANPEKQPLLEPLVIQPFQSPAFLTVEDGRVVAHELPPAQVLKTGEARWADLVTATGEVLADASVRAIDDPEAEDGDILLDRTDVQRGGMCTLTRVTLTLPLQS